MRLPLDWLTEFIPLPPTPELVDGLNLGGFDDAVVEDTGPASPSGYSHFRKLGSP